MVNDFSVLSGNGPQIGLQQSATKTGLALGSAYTYGSAGAAVGFRFVAPTSGNLNSIYFFVTAILGTPGVTTVELRNCISGTTSKPGTTLHATQTVSPGTAANKWIKCTFDTPYSVTLGVEYWIVLGDAGWTTGKTASVLYISGALMVVNRTLTPYTTANGFSSAGALSSNAGGIVFVFADGTITGAPYTANTAYANNNRERGLKIIGLTENLKINGVFFIASASDLTTLKIYKGTTAPGGTTELTVTLASGAKDVGAILFSPFTLLRNTIYRIVLSAGASNTTTPKYFEIEDYATGGTDLINCGLGGGTITGTQDDGAGGWTDSPGQLCCMALQIVDQVARIQPRFQIGLPGCR